MTIPFVKGLAYKQGRLGQMPLEDVHCIIIHTTGGGVWRRWKTPESYRGREHASPFAAAQWVYTEAYHFNPHFLVDGDTGQCIQLTPLSYIAQTVGKAQSNRYWSTGWPRVRAKLAWWVERFPNAESPATLLDGKVWGRDRSANSHCWAIEVSPPKAGPTAPWSPAALETLARLVEYLRERRNLEELRLAGQRAQLAPLPVLSHSEVHPIARTRSGNPWDPPPSQWNPGVREALDADGSRYLAARALEVSQ